MAEENDKAAGSRAHDGGGPRRRHVLLFPVPYQGHVTPMFRLAGVLHSRGFAVTVFHTHFNAPDPAHHPRYRFVPVPDDGTACAPGEGIKGVVAHVVALGGACEAAFRARLSAVLEEYYSRDDAVACLVADAHLPEMVGVANALGVPALTLRTGSAACFAGFLAFPTFCEKGYVPVENDAQAEMELPELPPYRVRDLMHYRADGFDKARELLARAVAAVKASSGLILNTFDALEGRELAGLRRDLSIPVFDVGPLHVLSPAADSSLLRQDASCVAWLDAWPTDSVLYVSFGSLASMSPRDLVETAWGLAASGVPFLWVLRPGLVKGEQQQQLPDGFEAATRGRGLMVDWAPQEEVLRHGAVGGFWTHNGWNSTTESVCAGLPMLCRPSFGDQRGNAAYVERVWRVGFELEGELERGGVEAAVRRLMVEEDGAEMRARAVELKRAAEECVRGDGSSCLAIEKLVAHITSR
ncbi:hypothetical protein PR202_gb11266 [Eleusine coracana subsp. coracana]|uniref:2,4-dihydroxy-7-methoxy-2H-1,4-benzoxazin-3(4H)-one 2-D-glucosyltransferase n=1 Tax=Eleusine coracana subsp. coracana TaxID=191504 RepID=A0AAV5EML9_ELECO|nr:hypothetical protein QOZ80_3BG0264980 [Eleusine coracana subsp. coracana]GJN23602.1 hypothetical protein PR202_gb11266 [Eleusine coracana subsp. coracana]